MSSAEPTGPLALNSMTLAQAAFAYASIGWHIFPLWGIGEDGHSCRCPDGQRGECKEAGKHPLVRWKEEATNDTDRIIEWWQKWPWANIGLKCGQASGVVVLDLDVKELADGGELDGADSFAAWTEENGLSFRRGLEARTGGGGSHVFFQDPGVVDTLSIGHAIGWLPGVDIKGNGGYVLLAPSRHRSGRTYAWEGGTEPVPLGEKEAQELRRAKGRTGTAAGSGGTSGGLGNQGYDYARAKREGPPLGHRDEFFNAYAFELRKAGHTKDVARATIQQVWAVTTQEPDPYPLATAMMKVDRAWEQVTPDENVVPGGWTPRIVPPTPPGGRGGGGGAGGPADAPLDENRPLDDMFAIEKFAELNADHHRFTPNDGWYAWNGQYWKPDPDGALVKHYGMRRLVVWYEDESLRRFPHMDEEAQRRWEGYIKSLRMMPRLNTIPTQASTHPLIRVETLDEWNPDPLLLCVANGTIDLRTGELKPHDPADLCTMQSPVEWQGLDVPCPKWQKQMAWMTAHADGTPDPDEERKIWVWAGYSLTGSVQENKALMMKGKGRNGKSVFTETFARVMGTYAAKADPNVFIGRDQGHQTELFALRGKRFAYGSELPERNLNLERFLRLTGESEITAREMYGKATNFKCQTKFWTHGNQLPKVAKSATKSDGYWRRVAPLMCERQIGEEEKDPTLKDQWWEERSGILAWAVRGCLEWQRAGLVDTIRGKSALLDYREEENLASEFAESYFASVLAPEDEWYWVPNSVLNHLWEEYCRENSVNTKTSINEVKDALRALNFGRDSDRNPRKVKYVFLGEETPAKNQRGITCPPLLNPSLKNWVGAHR